MAAEPFSTTRRTLLGAAAALPIAALPAPVIARTPDLIRGPRQSSPAHETWNRRLAEYRRCLARWQHESEAGAFHAANEEYNRHFLSLSARFGSWPEAIRSPIGAPLCAAAFAPMSAAEETFYDDFTAPMQHAADRLALTPPTDLPALLAKIRVMQEHELDELDLMTRPVLEVLAEDVDSLLVDG